MKQAAAKSTLAKSAGKHAAKKHAAEKHAAKKHAAKEPSAKKAPGKKAPGKKTAKKSAGALDRVANELNATAEQAVRAGAKGAAKRNATRPTRNPEEENRLERAFHHMHRAAAVISLLEEDTGGDLRGLLEHGMELYRAAAAPQGEDGTAECATGLLRAAEHLSMAGLYEARSKFRVHVPPPSRGEVAQHLRELGPRLDQLDTSDGKHARRLCSMARELLRRAEAADHDPHLEYELTMAAEGICSALESGL